MIELVCVILVLGILAGFTVSFLDTAVHTYILVKEQNYLYTEGAYIMERLQRELSDAQSVTTPASGEQANNITFITAAHASPHPSTRASKTITYSLTGRNLIWNNGGSNRYIGRNVKTFQITHNSNETITVSLVISSTTDTSIPDFTIDTTIFPNNYSDTSYKTNYYFNGDYYENVN